ncbi:unnamed protein product [[Candida] boidinii]|nr:unnamed protein product [[Candida] boidinii]
MGGKTLSSILHPSASGQLIDDLNNASQDMVVDNPGAALTAYHRWTVWRRQQMSFKNRHERSLAVDGYQVYILPFSENRGSWYENSKTSSFNMSQILKCKKSSKVPTHFKIVINKSGTLKKYYLEAISVTECDEIVSTINTLIRTYRREHVVQ